MYPWPEVPSWNSLGQKSASPFTGSWRIVATANLRWWGAEAEELKWSGWFIGWNNFKQVLDIRTDQVYWVKETRTQQEIGSPCICHIHGQFWHTYIHCRTSAYAWSIYTWSEGIPESITHRRWFGIITGVDTSPSSLQLSPKRSRRSRKGHGFGTSFQPSHQQDLSTTWSKPILYNIIPFASSNLYSFGGIRSGPMLSRPDQTNIWVMSC